MKKRFGGDIEIGENLKMDEFNDLLVHIKILYQICITIHNSERKSAAQATYQLSHPCDFISYYYPTFIHLHLLMQ
uniref:Uncharacterized protein n=1 Tax=Solanum lycopersicum TaxID=4081 RepID=A0A3Q7FNL8_SOLLC